MRRIAILAVITALIFSSCDDFYSDSMGSSREYDWRNIDVSANNVSDWVLISVGNPALATAVQQAILHRLETVNDSRRDRAILLEYSSRLALESSGVGNSILIRATDMLDIIGSDAELDVLVDSLTEILRKLQEDFKSGGGSEAAQRLAALLKFGINDQTGIPTFDQEYINSIQPSDVTEAIVVLLLGEMTDNNDYDIDNLYDLKSMGLELTRDDPPKAKVIEDGNPPSDNAVAIAAYINLMATNPEKFENSPLTGAINGALVKPAEEVCECGEEECVCDEETPGEVE